MFRSWSTRIRDFMPRQYLLLACVVALALTMPRSQMKHAGYGSCSTGAMPADLSGVFRAPPNAADGWHTRMNMEAGLARIFVNLAIAGASRRLEDDVCRQVLTDFGDGQGRTLAAALRESAKDPTEFLARLWFVDGSRTDQCLHSQTLAAYTAPGSRVIWICSARFSDPSYSLQGIHGDIIIIHELLHTLGLRENPPSSAQITKQVRRRCGNVNMS
jgi:hypothetical protein